MFDPAAGDDDRVEGFDGVLFSIRSRRKEGSGDGCEQDQLEWMAELSHGFLLNGLDQARKSGLRAFLDIFLSCVPLSKSFATQSCRRLRDAWHDARVGKPAADNNPKETAHAFPSQLAATLTLALLAVFALGRVAWTASPASRKAPLLYRGKDVQSTPQIPATNHEAGIVKT
jgi:hypothetical protein